MPFSELWIAALGLAGADAPAEPFDIRRLIPALALILVAFYFIIFRPQKREQQDRQRLLNNLKKGDRVVTIGGVHGEVAEVSDQSVTLRVAPKIEIKFNRSAISTIVSSSKGKEGEKE